MASADERAKLIEKIIEMIILWFAPSEDLGDYMNFRSFITFYRHFNDTTLKKHIDVWKGLSEIHIRESVSRLNTYRKNKEFIEYRDKIFKLLQSNFPHTKDADFFQNRYFTLTDMNIPHETVMNEWDSKWKDMSDDKIYDMMSEFTRKLRLLEEKGTYGYRVFDRFDILPDSKNPCYILHDLKQQL
jgi:hypothetical protein